MAIAGQIWDRFSALVDNRPLTFGSLHRSVAISIPNNEVFDVTYTIANATNTLVYNDELGTFSFLAVSTDYNSRMLLTDSAANTMSFHWRGTGTSGELGSWFKLTTDDTSSGQTLTSVRVFNTSGSTLKCRIVVLD